MKEPGDRQWRPLAAFLAMHEHAQIEPQRMVNQRRCALQRRPAVFQKRHPHRMRRLGLEPIRQHRNDHARESLHVLQIAHIKMRDDLTRAPLTFAHAVPSRGEVNVFSRAARSVNALWPSASEHLADSFERPNNSLDLIWWTARFASSP